MEDLDELDDLLELHINHELGESECILVLFQRERERERERDLDEWDDLLELHINPTPHTLHQS